MPLNLDRERRLLDATLQERTECLDPELRDLAVLLPQRIGKGDARTRWVDCFADLTLLYPLLVVEPWETIPVERARNYLLPHALLVLHAHLDDRSRDCQIDASAGEKKLTGWLLDEARLSLETTTPTAWDSGILDILLAEYAEAQRTRAAESIGLARLVIGRHLPGVVASVCALEAGHCGEAAIERVLAGFRHLVLSLQWMDDFRDIEEDLETGAENLLLSRVPIHDIQVGQPGDVIAWLHSTGHFSLAMEECLGHVSSARSIATSLLQRSREKTPV